MIFHIGNMNKTTTEIDRDDFNRGMVEIGPRYDQIYHERSQKIHFMLDSSIVFVITLIWVEANFGQI